ncbi:MAG: hypothetical protein QOJ83_3078, partial [Frankiales bacterium]|nr:hypothetical protein [Frankiales bacterium]
MPPMRITSRGFAAVTVGLVSAVVLAGCSSNSTKPTVLPSLQTTSTAPTSAAATTTAPGLATTTTPSETTKGPTSSNSAIEPLASTSAAMATAVKSYYAMVNRAIKDSTGLKAMSESYTSACQQCIQDQQGIAQFHNKHDTLVGGGYRL